MLALVQRVRLFQPHGVSLFKGTLLPMGVEGTDYYSETDEFCSTTSTGDMNGAGCTYKALTDKDYFKNLHK